MNLLKYCRMTRIALTPKGWLLRARLSNGAQVLGKNLPGYGGRGVYMFRDALEPELLDLEHFLNPGAVFVDVGANTGVYTLKAARYLTDSNGLVLALEPFADVLATLLQSILLNGFTNVRLRNLSAGAGTDPATLYMNANKPNSFSLLKMSEGTQGISTLVVSLDDLFKWERLTRLDYLKIDAEGAEAQILAGAARTIAECRPLIQVEVMVCDVCAKLPDYSAFEAPGSPNRVFIPNESKKIAVAKELSWTQVL